MPGPCSFPAGASRLEYEGLWDLVCDYHMLDGEHCTPDFHNTLDKHGDEITHRFIFKREWLAKRNRLRTGKTK